MNKFLNQLIIILLIPVLTVASVPWDTSSHVESRSKINNSSHERIVFEKEAVVPLSFIAKISAPLRSRIIRLIENGLEPTSVVSLSPETSQIATEQNVNRDAAWECVLRLWGADKYRQIALKNFISSLRRDRSKTQEAEDLLERMKQEILATNILPRHIRDRLRNVTVVVANDAPTFGSMLSMRPGHLDSPVILLNSQFVSTLSPIQFAFLLAHELGHVYQDDALFTAQFKTAKGEDSSLLDMEMERRSDILGALLARKLFPHAPLEELLDVFTRIDEFKPLKPEWPSHLRISHRRANPHPPREVRLNTLKWAFSDNPWNVVVELGKPYANETIHSSALTHSAGLRAVFDDLNRVFLIPTFFDFLSLQYLRTIIRIVRQMIHGRIRQPGEYASIGLLNIDENTHDNVLLLLEKLSSARPTEVISAQIELGRIVYEGLPRSLIESIIQATIANMLAKDGRIARAAQTSMRAIYAQEEETRRAYLYRIVMRFRRLRQSKDHNQRIQAERLLQALWALKIPTDVPDMIKARTPEQRADAAWEQLWNQNPEFAAGLARISNPLGNVTFSFSYACTMIDAAASLGLRPRINHKTYGIGEIVATRGLHREIMEVEFGNERRILYLPLEFEQIHFLENYLELYDNRAERSPSGHLLGSPEILHEMRNIIQLESAQFSKLLDAQFKNSNLEKEVKAKRIQEQRELFSRSMTDIERYILLLPNEMQSKVIGRWKRLSDAVPAVFFVGIYNSSDLMRLMKIEPSSGHFFIADKEFNKLLEDMQSHAKELSIYEMVENFQNVSSEDLMFTVLWYLLVRGNMKDLVWFNGAKERSLLTARGLNPEPFYNLSDPAQTTAVLHEVIESGILQKSLVGDVRRASGYELSDLLELPELLHLYADQVAEILGHSLGKRYHDFPVDSPKRTQIDQWLSRLTFMRSKGIEFKLSGREVSEINLGNRTGDCTASRSKDRRENVAVNFWTVPFWMVNPVHFILTEYRDGEFWAKYCVVVMRGPIHPVLYIHALEVSTKASTASPTFQDPSIRKEMINAAFAKVLTVADQANIEEVVVLPMSNTEWLNDYVEKQFPYENNLLREFTQGRHAFRFSSNHSTERISHGSNFGLIQGIEIGADETSKETYRLRLIDDKEIAAIIRHEAPGVSDKTLDRTIEAVKLNWQFMPQPDQILHLYNNLEAVEDLANDDNPTANLSFWNQLITGGWLLAFGKLIALGRRAKREGLRSLCSGPFGGFAMVIATPDGAIDPYMPTIFFDRISRHEQRHRHRGIRDFSHQFFPVRWLSHFVFNELPVAFDSKYFLPFVVAREVGSFISRLSSRASIHRLHRFQSQFKRAA